MPWPAGHIPVSVQHRWVLHEADPALKLAAGVRVNLLVRQVNGPAETAGTAADRKASA